MASGALDPVVRTLELEIRVQVVVELGGPTRSFMTASAVISQATGVDVIVAMASNASYLIQLEVSSRVTCLAFDNLMEPGKRKLAVAIMVESHDPKWGASGVTPLAIFTQLARVSIRVAGKASGL